MFYFLLLLFLWFFNFLFLRLNLIGFFDYLLLRFRLRSFKNLNNFSLWSFYNFNYLVPLLLQFFSSLRSDFWSILQIKFLGIMHVCNAHASELLMSLLQLFYCINLFFIRFDFWIKLKFMVFHPFGLSI